MVAIASSKPKWGLCQDPLCEDKDEPYWTRLYRGAWRCDGCIEGIEDADTFERENYLDMAGN